MEGSRMKSNIQIQILHQISVVLPITKLQIIPAVQMLFVTMEELKLKFIMII